MTRHLHQERSPDQFGAMFCTLPTMTPGYLHPPLPVPSHVTMTRVSELTPGKLPNGLELHESTGSNLQGTYLISTFLCNTCFYQRKITFVIFAAKRETCSSTCFLLH